MDLVDAMMSLKRSGNIDEAMRHYNAKRGIDVRSRTLGVDLLNRSLLTGFLPVQMARYAGLASLGRIAPLRQILMREGMDPGSGLRSFGDLRHGRM
jgi:2-octaprenyl-6-methoxyphenol hydroxylase